MRRLALCLLLCACKPPRPAGPGPVERLTLAGMACLSQRVGGAQPGERVPLILSLHPMGGSAEGALELVSGLKKPARVLAPCGRQLIGGCLWYELREATGPSDAAQAVLRAAAELRAREPFPGKPLVTGFSQGAVVALTLAEEHPEAIAAAFPVAGALQAGTSRALLQPLPPVHAFSGEKDPVFPPAAVQETIALLRAQGYPAVVEVMPGLEHDVDAAELGLLHAAIEAALPQ